MTKTRNRVTPLLCAGIGVGFLVLFAACSAGSDQSSLPEPQAGRLPDSFRALDASGTPGHVLVSSRRGARSATALVRGALDELASYFDGRPRVTGGFVDRGDGELQASFQARVEGVPVSGLAVAAVVNGQGTVAVAYDRAAALPSSLGRLMETLRDSLPRPAPRRQVSWQSVMLPDGSGSMRLPAGWQITGAYQGIVDARGPEGMGVSLGGAYQVFTPQGVQTPYGSLQAPLVAPYSVPVTAIQVLLPQFIRSAQAMGQPTQPTRWVRLIEQKPAPGLLPGGQSAFLHYELDLGMGYEVQRYRCLSLVGTTPISYDMWMYYNSSVAAPVEVFKRNLPVLMEIWQSWRVADHVLRQRLQNAVTSMQEMHRIYQQANQSRQQGVANAMDDWAEYMRGYRTVEDTHTGERSVADLGHVRRIVEKMNEREGWNRYREIPLRDL